MPKGLMIFITIFALLAIPTLAFSVVSDEEIAKNAKEIEEKKEDIDSVNGDLSDINSEISQITSRINNLSSQVNVTQGEINGVLASINNLSAKIVELEDLLNRFNSVLLQKSAERDGTIRGLYKASRQSTLQMVLSSVGFLDLAKNSMYFKSYLGQSIDTIKRVNSEIEDYSNKKAETEKAKTGLETQKARLEQIKATLATQVQSAQGEVAGLQSQASALEDQLSDLSDSLEELSEKQNALLREKFGASSERLTVGDSESGRQSLPDPGFSGTAYAFFTRGYPHRVGMNQYGAKGRADDGQDYEEILDAYYPNTSLEGECDKDLEIPVAGYGDIPLEEYLYGLGEMPSSWNMEALKAQAVAARSYALNYTQGGRAICTDQRCQVYLGHEKGGRWNQAVDATCGQYLSYNGSPIPAWYASTAGGFVRSSADVWGSSRPYSQRLRDGDCGDWENCSYDGPEYGDSPWFHKAWGKGTENGPWMTEEQAQDVFNAYLLSKESSSYNSDLSPADKGGISEEEVIEKLKDEDVDPVGEISKIEVYDDGEGYTSSIKLYSANYSGGITFDGYKFKSIFNLRAPGTIVIWTSFYD
ncbi:SpoIID/LytB domain-containing protein, partial [Patescibacteria group bacterium]|nr:SpoIID/LytB domain-containing protein [Patescibacteria group bacterium]